MIEKLNIKNIDEIKDQLFKFVWEFKHGNNIMYNFEILKALYAAKDNSSNQYILIKPITITIISIIEMILIDFLTRIDQATLHRPSNIEPETLKKLKQEIRKERVPAKIEGKSGERIYYKLKMYSFRQIIKLLEKYELFGKKNDTMYELLGKFGDMRNRVHIENYHQNLEKDEYKVFTSHRLNELENVLCSLWNKMISDYKRPWKDTAN